MGIVNYTYNRTTSGGEIVRELVNSTDGQGLHFDGVAGNIDIASPPDLGTKFSFEFILQADSFASTNLYFVDFGNGGRFIFGTHSSTSYNWAIFDNSSWNSFGVKVVDDLKVHHLVVTVDGTAAILYDNGNQVGTATISASHGIDSCADLVIGSAYSSAVNLFNGTIYRARFWNRTLSEAEVKDSYDNPSVKFSNQYGSETDLNVMSCANGSTNPYTSFTSASATGFTAVQIGAVASSAGTADEIALVKGKDYRVTFYIANSGQAPKVSFAEDLNIGTPLQEIVGLGTLTSDTHTYDITYTGATTTGVLVFENTAAASYAIANLSITRIGVVADLDLAFSNMTQSDKVRDRSTNNVTGTASSGVKQVTPIEQLNAKSAKFGTAQSSPADGSVEIGNDLEVGTDSTGDHSVIIDSAAGGHTGKRFFLTSKSASPQLEIGISTDRDMLTIDSSGNVNIGGGSATFAAGGGLRVEVDTFANVRVCETGNTGVDFAQDASANGYLYNRDDADLIFGANNTEQMRIDSSGAVNINSGTVPAGQKLYVRCASDSNLAIGDASGTVKFNALNDANSANVPMEFGVASLSVVGGLATFGSGIAVTTGGVKFPATQSASADANVLDDYEEGSWSAVPAGGTSAGTYTSVYSTNTYTKIGRQVTVQWNIAWSSHTGSGDLQITGLPFASGGSGIGTFQCNSGLSWTAGYLPAAYISGSTITFRNTDDGGSTYQMLQIAATVNYLRGTLTYFV